jgi:hypothetical protein
MTTTLNLFSQSPSEVQHAITTISFTLITFLSLAFVIFLTTSLKAYYGRYTQEGLQTNMIWRVVIPGLIDWVGHCTSIFAVIYCIYQLPQHERENLSVPRIILLVLFSIHYINRSFIHAWLVRKNCKPIPLLTMLLGSGFCLINGLNIARYLSFASVSVHLSDHNYIYSPRFIIGILIWCIGFIGNISHDRYLVYLKNQQKGYQIPRWGLFHVVSGANFLFEIIEWFGFWIVAQGWACFSFFWVSLCAISPRAYHHHQWYLQKFGDSYPKHRRAIIPFVV